MLDVDLGASSVPVGTNGTGPEQLAEALLYQGCILYPYRQAPKKNCRERFHLGRVYPQAYSHAPAGSGRCSMQTECLLVPRTDLPVLEVYVQFLQPVWRHIAVLAVPQLELAEGTEPDFIAVPELSLDGKVYQTWQEVVERTVSPIPLTVHMEEQSSSLRSFEFSAGRSFEPILNATGEIAAVFLRRHDSICGLVELEATPLRDGAVKVTIRVSNASPLPAAAMEVPDAVLMRTFISTHTILHAHGGEFVSLADPPAAYREAAQTCRNLGTWPALVGQETAGERDTLLSSPIILDDYPKIARPSGSVLSSGAEPNERHASNQTQAQHLKQAIV